MFLCSSLDFDKTRSTDVTNTKLYKHHIWSPENQQAKCQCPNLFYYSVISISLRHIIMNIYIYIYIYQKQSFKTQE